MRYVFACVLFLGLILGCGEGSRPFLQTWSVTKPPVAASEPTSMPAVMATVDGRPIYMSDLNDLLVRAHGVAMAYQLVAGEMVRQAAEANHLSATDREVQEEGDRTMAEMFGLVERGGQRERLLDEWLRQRGMSYKQWQMIMLRNVLLRKLVEPRVTVSDEDLAKEFGRQYGRKVQVRHIQTESLTSAQQALKKLEEGADFAELARQMSVNPSAAEGGLLPPIDQDSRTLPPALTEAALALKRVGETTDPIQVETAFHILKLEKIIEPQNVKFADVKDKLSQDVRRRRLRSESQKLLGELIKAAQDGHRIQYVDPVLKAQVQAAQEEARTK
jgi:foldase protein PrsA